MKKLIFFSLFLGSLSVWAQNPLIRTCRLTQGQFLAIPFPGDQVAFCRYGEALIDALSIYKLSDLQGKSLAVSRFEASAANRCEDVQAVFVSTIDDRGRSFELCRFSDDSWIELPTLQRGPRHVLNQGLVRALQTFP
jgi:hypothetical protein